MERVNRLSAALDRMGEGAHGTCVECGEGISATRRSVFAASEYGTMAAASQAFIRASYLPSEDDRDVRVPGTLRAAASF